MKANKEKDEKIKEVAEEGTQNILDAIIKNVKYFSFNSRSF